MKEERAVKVYKPEILECPKCNSKLKYCYTISNKVIQFTSSKAFRIKNLGYKCPNCNDIVYFSQTANKLAIKGYTYSTKVSCMILYYRRNNSREYVCDFLSSQGVDISDRNVDIIYNMMQDLLNLDYDTKINESYERQMQEYNEIRLSIDLITIDKKIYVILHDYFTGEIIALWHFENLDDERLDQMLSKYLSNKNIKVIFTVRPFSGLYSMIKQKAKYAKVMSFLKF